MFFNFTDVILFCHSHHDSFKLYNTQNIIKRKSADTCLILYNYKDLYVYINMKIKILGMVNIQVGDCVLQQ